MGIFLKYIATLCLGSYIYGYVGNDDFLIQLKGTVIL